MKLSCSRNVLIAILWLLGPVSSFALTTLQEQEIRHTKALVLLSQYKNKQALMLLKRNLDGAFHRKTLLTLARFFYKQKKFSKSFRLYQTVIKRGLGSLVSRTNFNPRIQNNFIRILDRLKKPSVDSLAVAQELANKYYSTYQDKTLPEEFLGSALNLSEKYYFICRYFNYFKGESSLFLARISLIKSRVDPAIDYLKESLEIYESKDRENQFKDETLSEDIKILLAEAYIKKGKGDVGLLLIRSLSAKSDLNPTVREYTKNYLSELEASFVSAILSYGVKQKKNINQLSDSDYENFDSLSNRSSLGERDALVQALRLNVFMNRQISDKYNISGSLDVTNENALSSQIDQPNFTNMEFDLNLKRYRDDNSILNFDYKFNNLSGRDLDSLRLIQPANSHKFTFGYQWLWKGALVKFEFPLEFSSFESERSTTSLGVLAKYESLSSNQWFSPEYYSYLGRRSEGELFDSSLVFQMGINNRSAIAKNWTLVSNADLYFNKNSNELLSFNELTLSINASRELKVLKGLSLNLSFLMTRRSFSESIGNFNMNEIVAGLTYNF